ncbi:P-loop containing nucleoside triphosphate hydrolases superfamily protein [Wolffia australiana]
MEGMRCSPACSAVVTHRRRSLGDDFFSRRGRLRQMKVSASANANSVADSTKLVTFLGKGGSGRSTAAALAAQYYASEGLRTCLVVHSQDPTPNFLMGCEIGTSPVTCNKNLVAVRLETTKLLLEPLNQVKKADTRVNLSQGVLEGVVGEELGVLPGMDSIFSALEIEKLTNSLGRKRKDPGQTYDVVVYDGTSTEETLRMIGAAERARWYLKHIRNMAEKTDIGRLTAPSVLKLITESMGSSGVSIDGKTSTEIWDNIEQNLQKASAFFTDPSRFRSFLVVDPRSQLSISSGLRYWGCAIQAGARISGVFGFSSGAKVPEQFSPLAFAVLPYSFGESTVEWDKMVSALSDEAKSILDWSQFGSAQPLVRFDGSKRTVTLFMPGFDKSQIKLFQYRGGTELLVEAGDQRRVIQLPSGLQGKVAGAKFENASLVVTLR